ncbi:MAG TPA: sugar transferase [Ktedonobacterales bacterium]|nr:sugar transferase [Ktedonobacterales bacterium]
MDVGEQRRIGADYARAQAARPGTSDHAWPAPAAQPVLPIYSVDERLRRRKVRSLMGRASLFLLDATAISASFYVAYYIRFILFAGVRFTTPYLYQTFSSFLGIEIVATIVLLLAFALKGLYRLRTAGTWFRQVWIIGSAATTAFAIFTVYEYVFQRTDIFVENARALVTLAWVTIIVLVGLMRLLISGFLILLYRRGVNLTPVLVVGSSKLGKLMMQQVAASPSLGYHIVGFVREEDAPQEDFGRFPCLGDMSDLDAVLRGHRIEQVIIAIPSHQHERILSTVSVCERAGSDFRLVPDLYELSLSRIDVDALEGIPLIGLRRSLTNSIQYRIKRIIDVTGALAVLIIGLPIWLLIALAIKLDSPGPVLYTQPRLGYRGQPFGFFKFRSMRVDADKLLNQVLTNEKGENKGKVKAKDDPRRTRVGKLIRRTSLDEIPQLINVLRGDMSLIGPRPMPARIENYEDWERARFEMLPGMTGLWQVRGRSDLDYDEMVLMDIYYIENWSLNLDLQIALRTLPAVLGSQGAY